MCTEALAIISEAADRTNNRIKELVCGFAIILLDCDIDHTIMCNYFAQVIKYYIIIQLSSNRKTQMRF